MLLRNSADITAPGRFTDCLLAAGGQCHIRAREFVHDKGNLHTVEPGETLALDSTALVKCPHGFRRLDYVQASDGSSIRLSIPDPYIKEEQAIYAKGKAWLKGASA